MTIKQIHDAFKIKVNKLDSNQNRNIKVPFIDFLLNEAQDLFIRLVAEPRVRQRYGFEIDQRTIDDIREIVVSPPDTGGYTCDKYDDTSYTAPLPSDYKYLVRSYAFADKGQCKRKLRCYQVQQDDVPETSFSYKPSFEWGEVNLHFLEGNRVRLYTDGTFELRSFLPSYIREPKRMHNAVAVDGYRLGDEMLTGTQTCELSDSACREIIDLAAYLATNNINMPEMKNKFQKTKINETL